MYKCGKCRESVLSDISTVGGIQCEKCGSKIFYKQRPNVKRVIKAR
jgi:DNA-directed RNA polymerase subunit P